MSSIRVSVLDLLPVRSGQSTSEALDAARKPGAGRGRGGGPPFPDHAPLAVAEQFALLEAAYPGRIDLGLGRAPGTDPVTSWALRAGRSEQDQVQRFPDHVEQVMAFMSPHGAAVQIGARQHEVLATPLARQAPPVWLLGSSDYSAQLAARLGLPYVFAHHFSGRGTARALELYRTGFAGEGEPRTFLTVNAVVGDTAAQAQELALPFQHMMASLQVPGPLQRRPLMTVDEAVQEPLPLPPPAFEAVTDSWLLGTADEVVDQARVLAAEFDIEEIMVQPVAGAYDGDPADRDVHRERTVAEVTTRLR